MGSVRRTMRFYSSDEPPAGVIEACIETAGTSPSGAHHQPWFFVVVRSLELKTQIRALVEEEERINYERRMRKSWIDDLSSMTGYPAKDATVPYRSPLRKPVDELMKTL